MPLFNEKMKKNSKNKKNDNNVPELMINILCVYLKGLTYDYINYISNTIMNNFIAYKQKMIKKKINNIFVIYTKQELLSIQNSLIKWYNNALYNIRKSKLDISNSSRDNYFHLNLNVGPIMNNSRGIPIIINNNNNANHNNNNTTSINHCLNNNNKCYIDNNNNINNIISNNSKNEINKYYHKVNNYINKNNKNKNNKNISCENNYRTINDSLSNVSSNNKLKQKSYSSEAPNRNKKIIPADHRGENCLFYQKMKNNRKISDKIVNKFIMRQEKYIKSNTQRKEKIIRDNEEEYKLIYTFEPKVNDSLRKLYKKDKLSASNRLYNDSILRKQKNLEKKNNNENKNIKKSFNQTKYIELYEESKLRKEKQEELIKKVERECGYTYAPKILNKLFSKNTAASNNNDGENNNKNKNNNVDKNHNIKRDNKSFNKLNKDNTIKNLKNLEKNNSCKNLVSLKKKNIKKNGNANGNNII